MEKWYRGAMLFALALVACSDFSQPPPTADTAHYAPAGWLAKSLPEIAAALQNGEVTSEELVRAYLARIEQIDWAGPELQSVLAINPSALEDARALDAKRAAGDIAGPLHGVPILLKDNIESRDPGLPTTAGALALKDNVTGRDSPLVAGLRAAGAVILGKTNLSQWANFRSRDSISGWSALGGQVRNPHMLDRSPCGSSSGSGVAVAASLATGAVGTETNGSIICPANVNGIVGFKPTVGLVPQRYIVPISSSQDTAGPMTKTVRGAAMMLNAMAMGPEKTDYVAALDSSILDGMRIGVLRFAQGSNEDIIVLFNDALQVLQDAGAELVEIEEFEPTADGFWDKAYDVLKFEFKTTLDAYLKETPATVGVRSLNDLIAFNEENADVELALFDQSIFDDAAATAGMDDAAYAPARDAIQRATRQDGIDALLSTNDVAVLVSPSGPVASRVDPVNGDVWPEWAGGGYLAAVAGYPHVSVPMGTVHAVPVGLSFMSGSNQDALVLSTGYAYEQRTGLRAEPEFLEDAEQREEIAAAMKRKVR
jgi:amidase